MTRGPLPKVKGRPATSARPGNAYPHPLTEGNNRPVAPGRSPAPKSPGVPPSMSPHGIKRSAAVRRVDDNLAGLDAYGHVRRS